MPGALSTALIKTENDQLIGQTMSHYRLTGLLGRGGMGVVYQGLDLNLNRNVAIKVMHDKLARHRSFRQQFLQEAQAAARLDHPNIVPIHQFGAHEQYLYMVMGLVDGGSLGSYMRTISVTGQLIELSETLALMAQIADGLDHAHSQGIVHRDIKPDNILLRSLETADYFSELPIRGLISDFGLARLAAEKIEPQASVKMGTLPYLSPEQCTGAPVDHRSDLYALGMVFYHLVTGRLPFSIENLAEAFTHHVHTPPPDPMLFNGTVPANVSQIILKSLAKKPAQRYQTAQEMAAVIRAAGKRMRVKRPPSNAQTSHRKSSSIPSIFNGADSAPRAGRLTESEIIVEPGQRVAVQLQLYNPTLREKRFSFTVEGLIENWFTIVEDNVVVAAQSAGFMTLALHPPRLSSSTAGDYPFTLILRDEGEVENAGSPSIVAETVPARLTVRPFPSFQVEISPAELNCGQAGIICINNCGNSSIELHVEAYETSSRVQLDISSEQIVVGSGQATYVPIQATSKDRPWIGRPERLPFVVQVADNEIGQKIEGHLTIQPKIRPGLIIVLFLLLTVVMAAIIIYLQQGANQTLSSWINDLVSNLLAVWGKKSGGSLLFDQF